MLHEMKWHPSEVSSSQLCSGEIDPARHCTQRTNPTQYQYWFANATALNVSIHQVERLRWMRIGILDWRGRRFSKFKLLVGGDWIRWKRWGIAWRNWGFGIRGTEAWGLLWLTWSGTPRVCRFFPKCRPKLCLTRPRVVLPYLGRGRAGCQTLLLQNFAWSDDGPLSLASYSIDWPSHRALGL